VLGADLWYLCPSCMKRALNAGTIRPGTCLRCGRGEAVNMGSLRAAGTNLTLWFRVCSGCRRQVETELGVA
jgi:hypothetical protein